MCWTVKDADFVLLPDNLAVHASDRSQVVLLKCVIKFLRDRPHISFVVNQYRYRWQRPRPDLRTRFQSRAAQAT